MYGHASGVWPLWIDEMPHEQEQQYAKKSTSPIGV
jgi:hypothetical protein